MYSSREFCREFFTQISEHFRAYLRLHVAHHPDLGISRKVFSSSGNLSKVTPILVKVDDVRSETKTNDCHGLSNYLDHHKCNHTNVKFSLYLKKPSLASRNVPYQSSYVESASPITFFSFGCPRACRALPLKKTTNKKIITLR